MPRKGSGGERQDPFAGLDKEPVEELGLTTTPDVLQRRPVKARVVRPAERRRRRRQLSVTFSIENADLPDRIRALARDWGLVAPDGRSPNVSAVVEVLVLASIGEAEQAETREEFEK